MRFAMRAFTGRKVSSGVEAVFVLFIAEVEALEAAVAGREGTEVAEAEEPVRLEELRERVAGRLSWEWVEAAGSVEVAAVGVSGSKPSTISWTSRDS